MVETSSLSNVRIINESLKYIKNSTKKFSFWFFINNCNFYLHFLINNSLLGNRITNLDALADFVGKDKVIGEFPLIDSKKKAKFILRISEELLNKAVYEITHLRIWKTLSV